jgi:hypothetical protein
LDHIDQVKGVPKVNDYKNSEQITAGCAFILTEEFGPRTELFIHSGTAKFVLALSASYN